MTYAPTWTQQNPAGLLVAGQHRTALADFAELADAINRRRRLVYQAGQDYTSQLAGGERIGTGPIATGSAPPFDAMRGAVTSELLNAATGVLGGSPPTPAAMDWLCPMPGANEGKRLVTGLAGAGEVSLFALLNGGGDWTDPTLTSGDSPIRAMHVNELRETVTLLSRGRWRLPVYLSAGLISNLPDTPWIGGAVGNTGSASLHTVGFAVPVTDDPAPRGLVNVTARSSSAIRLTVDVDCSVAVYRCHRAIDFTGDPPTWNRYDPSAPAQWALAGGTGAADATLVGTLALTAYTPGELTGSAVADAAQGVIDGAEPNWLIRRTDTGPETVGVSAELVVEFDLDSPPN